MRVHGSGGHLPIVPLRPDPNSMITRSDDCPHPQDGSEANEGVPSDKRWPPIRPKRLRVKKGRSVRGVGVKKKKMRAKKWANKKTGEC